MADDQNVSVDDGTLEDNSLEPEINNSDPEQEGIIKTEDQEPTEGSVEPEPTKKPKSRRAERRIKALIAKNKAAEEELALLRKQQQSIVEKEKKSPSREDFDDEDEYIKAIVDWRTEGILDKRKKEKKKIEADRKKREAVQERNLALEEMLERGADEYDDFEDVIRYSPGYTMNMANMMIEMDEGHKVAYYLGVNPDKASNIAKMSPYRQTIALSKIEKEITKTKNTKAKAPPSPTKGKTVASKGDPKDIDVWMKQRYAALSKKNKG